MQQCVAVAKLDLCWSVVSKPMQFTRACVASTKLCRSSVLVAPAISFGVSHATAPSAAQFLNFCGSGVPLTMLCHWQDFILRHDACCSDALHLNGWVIAQLGEHTCHCDLQGFQWQAPSCDISGLALVQPPFEWFLCISTFSCRSIPDFCVAVVLP